MDSKPGSSSSEQPQPELRPFYMTNQEKKESPQDQILETYTKLNKTIDDLEVHIEDAIKKHEAEFLFAYRNHMKKIKKELGELRRRSDQQEKQFSSNDKIVYLEKQITIFREEALKLYDKLEQKNHEADELRMQLKIYEKENVNYERELKELVRRIKGLELQLNRQSAFAQGEEEAVGPLDSPKSKRTQSRYFPSINANETKQGQLATSTTAVARKSLASILQQYLTPENLAIAVQQVEAWVSEHNQQVKQKLQKAAMHRRKPQAQPLLQNTEFQLKEWFLDCVRTIKKEIYKRKQQDGQQLGHIADINDFLSIDKLRLLELFLSNEQLLTHMYLKMFPDRLTQLRQLLSRKPEADQQSASRQRNTSMIVQRKPAIEYEFEDIERPSIAVRKPREPKSLLRNRIIIKNGKLNFTNS